MNNFAYLDSFSKKEIRRKILKAIAIPGYQVPFASKELPIARGWGTGGIQLTLSIIGPHDILKVIDQGSDDSVNAVSIKKFVKKTTDVSLTDDTAEATIIQSRHRIPEIPLKKHQVLILQVPLPEPLRIYEASEFKTKRLHAHKNYTGAWLTLFEQLTQYESIASGSDHPVMVENRYVMAPSPIPKFDNPKLNYSEALILFGAGREKKIYAIPPYTHIHSLDFEDVPFSIETFHSTCYLCGKQGVFMDEIYDDKTLKTYFQCNDTSQCIKKG
jgi:alpha-D-ribose 1-methylphosphonate 5-phosphate C-P lyase